MVAEIYVIIYFFFNLKNFEYVELLRKYKEINHFWTDNRTIKLGIVHFIPSVGPPVTARVRLLLQAQLRIAKHEFDYMLEKVFVDPLKVMGQSNAYAT